MSDTDFETCEISYDFILEWDRRHAIMYMNRKVHMRWIAVAYGPDGLYTAGQSPRFLFQWVTDPRDIEPTSDAADALRRLVDRLTRDSWVATTGGRYWFNRRFKRALNQASAS